MGRAIVMRRRSWLFVTKIVTEPAVWEVTFPLEIKLPANTFKASSHMLLAGVRFDQCPIGVITDGKLGQAVNIKFLVGIGPVHTRVLVFKTMELVIVVQPTLKSTFLAEATHH